MKTAMWPIGYARDMSMFHRIEMNVIDMAFKIGVGANGMLPIAALPDSFFPLAILLIDRDGAGPRPREKALLIKLQREEKSASPSGNTQSACRWSGKTQMAIVSNGRRN